MCDLCNDTGKRDMDCGVIGVEIISCECRIINDLEVDIELLKAAMLEFVTRVDNGEVRSVKTYNKFKQLLAITG